MNDRYDGLSQEINKAFTGGGDPAGRRQAVLEFLICRERKTPWGKKGFLPQDASNEVEPFFTVGARHLAAIRGWKPLPQGRHFIADRMAQRAITRF